MSGNEQTPSFLSGADSAFLEELYLRYRQSPQGVAADWRAWFESMEGNPPNEGADSGRITLPSGSLGQAPDGPHQAATSLTTLAATLEGSLDKQAAVSRLINTYRRFGYTWASLDPLDRPNLPHIRSRPSLALATAGLTEADLETVFSPGTLPGLANPTLARIVLRLQEIYCGTLGAEYLYLRDDGEREWLRLRLEDPAAGEPPPPAARMDILRTLVRAEMFEKFLQTQFVGQKRFSLEGAESFIAMLDGLVEEGAAEGMEEIVIGMPHRGRLNVLVNVLGKQPSEIFAEFGDIPEISETSLAGDVKYHLGYSADRRTRQGGSIHLSLSFNPSHLEAVNGVVEGNVRAKQEHYGDEARTRVLPVLVHGDAAFAGQGMVAETLNLSQLQGYCSGGTIHIIVNNNIGFTTNPRDSRSFPFPSDLAKMLLVPVFHVNGDDPEAVMRAVRLAVDYRQKFHRDVVIDLFCYRRLGHNEMDEPNFTQPLTYKRVANHPTLMQFYGDKLVEAKAATRKQVEDLQQQTRQHLTAELELMKNGGVEKKAGGLKGSWEGLKRGDPEREIVETDVNREVLEAITDALTGVPDGFTPHPRVAKLLETRRQMMAGAVPVDWGMGELLAYGSLLMEGLDIRLSGQDCRRGTFSHRHANLVDANTGKDYIALAHLPGARGRVSIWDSPLSEAGVLAFEFGYSLASPYCLTLWEGQFGDFANGAQVIIDQFITSSEEKWDRLSGLVLLLPHGYEGQGAEHSSARPERFLQMCAHDNIQVCVPTTAAQNFHLMRRQMHRPFRKPLVVMSPKSLLRLPQAGSSVEDLIRGHFRDVLWEQEDIPPQTARRIVFCSGKVYYDLLAWRTRQAKKEFPILRVEQLYPFPAGQVREVLARYPQAKEVVWAQEEPKNMGGWSFIRPCFEEILPPGMELSYAGRPAAASPATGSHRVHHQEQEALVREAME
ncbi:MAG: 2-oxoglutarate dehydrogenase E1 component [Deltaproteobacteria bacterium]|nr:2-oxoglutarate dehydrogenase E1 component [Deltaproteobacteria bacterium]